MDFRETDFEFLRFLSLDSRYRNSPSAARCVPFLSVAAKVEKVGKH
jgi:hypothetical protein